MKSIVSANCCASLSKISWGGRGGGGGGEMYKDGSIYPYIRQFQCILHFCVVAFTLNYRIKVCFAHYHQQNN